MHGEKIQKSLCIDIAPSDAPWGRPQEQAKSLLPFAKAQSLHRALLVSLPQIHLLSHSPGFRVSDIPLAPFKLNCTRLETEKPAQHPGIWKVRREGRFLHCSTKRNKNKDVKKLLTTPVPVVPTPPARYYSAPEVEGGNSLRSAQFPPSGPWASAELARRASLITSQTKPEEK